MAHPNRVNMEMEARLEKMNEVTLRVARLREVLIKTVPEICSDRAQLLTESYSKTFNRPMVERKALALSHILSNMKIDIHPNELIVGGLSHRIRGCQIFPEYGLEFIIQELDTFDSRIADKFQVTKQTKSELREIYSVWENNALSDVAFALFDEEEKLAVNNQIFALTALKSGVGHMIIDYPAAISKGLKHYKQKLSSQIDSLDLNDSDYHARKSFYKAAQIVCQAAMDFSVRYSVLASEQAATETDKSRKNELIEIARVCKTALINGAKTFHEAVQAFWFLHVIVQIESNGHSVSPGRFDQYMYAFLTIREDGGIENLGWTEEILQCLWLKFFEINKVRDKVSSIAFGGYPMFQNITLGGVTPHGDNAVNALSYLCLDTTIKIGLPQPSISVRWFYGCPDDFFLYAIKAISFGLGMPALFNDEVLIPNMLQLGYSLEEARNYAIIGCTETSVPANTEPWLTGGFINLLKVLELTIFDGIDPLTGVEYQKLTQKKKVTSFNNFESFYHHFISNLQYFLTLLVSCNNILDGLHGVIGPNIFASLFLEGCIDSGKTSLAGGAQYNFTTLEAVGIANVADSLATIKKLIYEEKNLSWNELQVSLSRNYSGNAGEKLLAKIHNEIPKYGNDDENVDQIARHILSDLNHMIKPCRNARGGKYNIALYSIATHVLFASTTGATPDGRKAGEVLADGGVSCSHGADLEGLTALLKSVSKLDSYKATGSTLLNVKLAPTLLNKSNRRKIMDIVKTYFLLKGQHIQFNVVSTDVLREAQKNPENYPLLTVRVAGFSVLFTTIDPLLQEDIIRRTEHYSKG